MPKVSVCIPAYNQPNYLKKTIESVLMQDYSDYEIIITDDSQGNEVKDLVDSFNSSKIAYFKNEKALGSPANWNYAIGKAKGEYIKILHHDDYLNEKSALNDFVNALDINPESHFAFSQTNVFNAQNKSAHVHSVTEEQLDVIRKNPEELILANLIGAPSATIYRKQNVFFDVNLKWLVDVDFYVQLLKANNKIIAIQKPLITSTDGASHQITQFCLNNPDVEIKEFAYEIEKFSIPKERKREFENRFLNLFNNYDISDLSILIRYAPFVNKELVFFKKIISLLPSYSKKVKVKNRIKSVIKRVANVAPFVNYLFPNLKN